MTEFTPAIVTVHFGDPKTTCRCIDSVADFAPGVSLFISDNSGNPEALRRHIEENGQGTFATVLENTENRGFAAGCNTGIRHALQQNFTHILLLNNDAILTPGSIEALGKSAKSEPRTIWGSTVVDMNAPERIQVAGGVGFNARFSLIAPAHSGAETARTATLPEPKLDYIYGAAMLVPTSYFQHHGLMDERYFLYYEELDLCLKARKNGYGLGWCRNSFVAHEGGTSTRAGTDAQEAPSPLAVFHEARSAILLTKKYCPINIVPTFLARLLGKSFLLAKRGQWNLIPPLLRGLFSGLAP